MYVNAFPVSHFYALNKPTMIGILKFPTNERKLERGFRMETRRRDNKNKKMLKWILAAPGTDPKCQRFFEYKKKKYEIKIKFMCKAKKH